MRTIGVLLLSIATACASSRAPRVAVARAPAVTHAEAAPVCSREDVELGPVTAAASFGPTRRTGCRLGPSPIADAHARIRGDDLLRDCLRTSAAIDLDVAIEVGPRGSVDRVTVLELAPEHADVDACVERIRTLRFAELGCSWQVRETW